MKGKNKLRKEKKLECSVTKTMEIIGKKWVILILYNLLSGAKRFKELKKSLKEICPKMLSQRLKELERLKLVEKKISGIWPTKITYQLTKKGRSLSKIILAIEKWGRRFET